MKSEFVEYFEHINISRTLQNRISDLLDIAIDICPEEIIQLHLSNYIAEDGSNAYDSMWFFSETFCLEAKQFLTESNLDITPYKNLICYAKLFAEDFNFHEADESSKLILDFKMALDITGTMKATGENCSYLYNIYKKYFKPYLFKG
jgi:hypothetical protein